MTSGKKSALWNAARLLLTVFLLAAIVLFVGLEKILETLSNFNVFFLPAIVLLMALIILLNALAVFVLFEPKEKTGFRLFLKGYLSSWAVGYVLPGKVGDFSLAFFLKNEVPAGHVSAVVLVEKLVSFSVLFLLGMLFLLKFGLDTFSVALFSAIVLGAVLFLAVSETGRNLLKKTVFRKNKELFAGFYRTVKACFLERTQWLALAFALAFCRAFVMGFSVLLMLEGFGSSADLFDITTLNSAVSIAAFVPVTVSGLGLREGSFVFLSSFLGLSGATAAGTMVVFAALNYSAVLLIFYFLLSWEIPSLFGKNSAAKLGNEGNPDSRAVPRGKTKRKRRN